jgi:hypothetical protein
VVTLEVTKGFETGEAQDTREMDESR